MDKNKEGRETFVGRGWCKNQPKEIAYFVFRLSLGGRDMASQEKNMGFSNYFIDDT